jgi:hypothetical protein
MTEQKFKKGDEIWFVRIDGLMGLSDKPVIRHGKMTGGGDAMIIIQWDHVRGSNRMSGSSAAKQYQHTKDEAIANAMSRLMARRDQASRDAEECTSQLYYLNELIGAQPSASAIKAVPT